MRADEIGLRLVLSLAGAFVIFTGVNIAFGGIATLGLQGSDDFFTVTDAGAFLTQDSHVRFLGGLWVGVGLTFALGAARLSKLATLLQVMALLIFLGGLARLTSLRFDVLTGPSLIGSLGAELIGMPILVAWLRSVTRPGRTAAAAL